jgi:hypothetical protein
VSEINGATNNMRSSDISVIQLYRRRMEECISMGAILDARKKLDEKMPDNEREMCIVQLVYYLSSKYNLKSDEGIVKTDILKKISPKNETWFEHPYTTAELLDHVTEEIENYTDEMEEIDRQKSEEMMKHLGAGEEMRKERAKKKRDAENVIIQKMNTALETQTPIELIDLATSDIHSGDHEVIMSIMIGKCCQHELTNEGFQPKAGGVTGEGKTASFRSAAHLLPPEDVIDGTLSNKAIFYDAKVTGKPSRCFVIDDAKLSEEMVPVIKTAMSDFQRPTVYRSVNSDRTGVVELELPERCMWLLTSCDDVGDEQLTDRFFPCSISRSKEAKIAITSFYADKDVKGESKLVVTDNVEIVRQMFRDIRDHKFRVLIPFAKEVVWLTRNIRLQRIYITVVKGHAVLNNRERNPTVNDIGETLITATRADFYFAYNMSQFSNKDTAEYHIPPQSNEGTIVRILNELAPGGGEVLLTEVTTKSGLKDTQVSQAFHGRDGKQGLLSKIPGLQVLSSSESRKVNEDVRKTKHNRIVIVPVVMPHPETLSSTSGIAYVPESVK